MRKPAHANFDGDRIDWKSVQGDLVLITVKDYKEHVATKFDRQNAEKLRAEADKLEDGFKDDHGELIAEITPKIKKQIEDLLAEADKVELGGPVVRADVLVLDGDQEGAAFENVSIFNGIKYGLIEVLDGDDHEVLGRPDKKKGWFLTDPTDDDFELAKSFLEDVGV